MTRVLPALHEGHAPIYLHHAFSDALDAYEAWGLHADEPSVRFDGRDVPISAIFGRMRSCHDILPERILGAVVDVVGEAHFRTDGAGVTYAAAAIVLRAMCVARLRDEAA